MKNNSLKSNVFVQILTLLKVKYTRTYANKFYNEHPHKYNLWGISKMLSDYKVDNIAIRVDDKENDINLIPVPFLAYVGSNFVVVSKKNANEIFYFHQGTEISLKLNIFLNIWSGVALLVESNENSCEPDYKKNKKNEYVKLAQGVLGGFCIILMCFILYVNNIIQINYMDIPLLLINILGGVASLFLVEKHFSVQNLYADRICSLFKYNDCNSISEVKESKLFGIWSLAEIGLSYFVSNIFVLLFFKQIGSYVALINVAILPFTFWSIWFQKYKLKQWCPLCLIVQLSLWLIFFVNIINDGFAGVDFVMINILLLLCVYLSPFLLIDFFTNKINLSYKYEEINQEFNSMKALDDVFLFCVKKIYLFSCE